MKETEKETEEMEGMEKHTTTTEETKTSGRGRRS